MSRTVSVGLPVLFRASSQIIGRLRQAVSDMTPADLTIVDLSDNKPQLARDYLLVELIDLFAELGEAEKCLSFALVLPHSLAAPPGVEGGKLGVLPSEMRLSAEAIADRKYRFFVFNRGGMFYELPRPGWSHASPIGDYRFLANEMINSPESNLRRGLVRRLGHYKSRTPKGVQPRCRRYSYVIDGPTNDLSDLLHSRWADSTTDGGAIIYDSVSNSWFSHPVASLGVRTGLSFFPTHLMTDAPRRFQHDVTASQRDKPAVLLVDVVDTGATVRRHLRRLETLGISHSTTVLAGIAMTESSTLNVDGRDYRVIACTVGDQKHVSETDCPQCRLGYKHTSDHDHDDAMIRSYDFWDMAEQAGWEAEPDVPPDRSPYELVPNFNAMLEKYGDWLGYKMAGRLRQHQVPGYLVVYPDQAGAVDVAEALRKRLGDHVPFVPIPDPLIKSVRKNEDTWAGIVDKYAKSTWCAELGRARGSGAVIVDVLNATGRTARALHALLELFGVSVFYYFPLVDRDIGREPPAEYPVERLTLYEWWGPEF